MFCKSSTFLFQHTISMTPLFRETLFGAAVHVDLEGNWCSELSDIVNIDNCRPTDNIFPTSIEEPGYTKHTVNSALRSRSPSPMNRSMAKGHVISDIINHKVKDWHLKHQTGIDDRDPFVVRKVDNNLYCKLLRNAAVLEGNVSCLLSALPFIFLSLFFDFLITFW